MAKANYVNGKDLMIFIGGKAIALASSCSLSVSADTLDASSKDDGCWKADDAGDLSWEATTDALLSFDTDRAVDAVFADLFDKMVARELVTVTFGVAGNASTDCSGIPDAGWEEPVTGVYYTGKAMITSLEATGEKGSAGEMSVSLTGNGALTKVDTTGD